MLKDIRKTRIKKLKALKKAGIDPYPAKTVRTHMMGEAIGQFVELSKKRKLVSLAGRVMAIRGHGGSTFLDLVDESGRIQCYFKEDILKKNYDFFLAHSDIGDFISVKGTLFQTKRGEKTLEVKKVEILAKALLPLPEKWHGLRDTEERYRKRYLDLIFSQDVKQKLTLRSTIINTIRAILEKEGFLEVETPMLQSIPGGALARPFKTHLNALNMDIYLRIAPELYLKRLLVGGFEKIYELGRAFRNEGIDRSHNPEFTILELYWAYQDYEGLMEFVETFFQKLLSSVFERSDFEHEGGKISIKGRWPRIEYETLLKEHAGIAYYKANEADLRNAVRELGIEVGKSVTKGELRDEIYKKAVQPKLIKPTFVINHPIEISPLAKRLESLPEKAARFQLVMGGIELVNGFSELNDPEDQLERFKEQAKMRKAGGEESHPMDKDFVEALEYGMPPAAGLGVGIDRLVALFTNSHNLREIIAFPTMRPRGRN